MIAVVDYQKGNLKSVERGLIAAGGEALITADASEIARAGAIVLPGVGAFADAAATMCELGQMEAIRDRVRAGIPFLGICLGEHLMFEHGVEGAPEGNPACGLGLLPGTVVAMPRCDAQGKTFKVPHVGWNTIEMPSCNGGAAVPPWGGGSGEMPCSNSPRFAAELRAAPPPTPPHCSMGDRLNPNFPRFARKMRAAPSLTPPHSQEATSPSPARSSTASRLASTSTSRIPSLRRQVLTPSPRPPTARGSRARSSMAIAPSACSSTPRKAPTPAHAYSRTSWQ